MRFLTLLLLAIPLWAQGVGGGISVTSARHIHWGANVPTHCNPGTGDIFFKTTSAVGPYYCSATDTWTSLGTVTVASALFSQTQSVTVGNSAAETTVVGTGSGSVTLPANYFTVGKTFRFMAAGVHSAVSNPNIEWKAKLGSTVILDTGTYATRNSANDAIFIYGIITCRTTGAMGTVIGQGYVEESGAGYVGMPNTTTQTVNTTGTLVFDLTVQWGTQSMSDTLTITNLVLFTDAP